MADTDQAPDAPNAGSAAAGAASSTPANLPGYAELHCISNFSFLRGASSPESLVAQAAQLGYRAIAITDECSMAGIVRAHTEARAQGIALLIGTEMRLSPAEGAPFRLVLIAQDRVGYGNLCERITHARMQAPKGQYLARPEDLTRIPGCLAILIPDACASLEDLDIQAGWLARHFALRAWIGISRLHRPGEARLRIGIGRGRSGRRHL